MLGQINEYGSIVAILARFALNFEIQVPQLKNCPRELKLSGSSCFCAKNVWFHFGNDPIFL